MSRTDLAASSDLSATTVTNLIAELVRQGLVVETGQSHAPRVGRPAIDVALVPSAGTVCGVQVGVGTVHVAACDLLATVLEEQTVAFDPAMPAGDVVELIVAELAALLEQSGTDRDEVIGVGVGAPGPVDPSQRMNLLSINLGWRNVAFSDRLERSLGIPTVVDHNVRAMALAEARYGRGAGVESLAFVYARTGVGAGLILNGEPYRGGTHGVTELGHLRIVEDGRECSCGSTGCLETVVSDAVLANRVHDATRKDPGGVLATALRDEPSPFDALVAAAKSDDGSATAILHEAARHLATGLANVVNLLNPELIVVGGLCADAGDVLLNPLRQALQAQAFPLVRDVVRVEETSFGASVGVVGAAAVALDRFFYSAGADWRPTTSAGIGR